MSSTTGNAADGRQNTSTARFVDSWPDRSSGSAGLKRLGNLLSAANGRRQREAEQRVRELEQENSRLYKRVEQLTLREANARYLANHDGLTGLCNRSLLMDRFIHAAAHAKRSGEHMALLLLDLDDFKAINDRKGHLGGDHVLKCVAARLEDVARSADTVCRYGGDEFVILLPGLASEDAARTVAERAQQNISDCISVDDDDPTPLTASCGIALFPRDGDNWVDLLEAADAAMYRCKPPKHNDADVDSAYHARWKRRHVHEPMLRMPANEQQQLSAGNGDTAQTPESSLEFDNH